MTNSMNRRDSIDRRSLLGAGAALSLLASAGARAAPNQGEFWLIRHGESEINVPRTIAEAAVADRGLDDGVKFPLTRAGMAQAKALARSMVGITPAAIFASTRLRAIQTADALCFALNCPLRPAEALVEIGFGHLAPTPGGTTTTDLLDIFHAWMIDNQAGVRAPGGESYNDVRARSLPFLLNTIRSFATGAQPLLLVSHGALIATMAPLLFDNVSPKFAFNHLLPNVGVVKGVHHGAGRLTCADWNGEEPS